jgi:hypothetical protein
LFAGFGVGTWADNIKVINIKTNVKIYFFIKLISEDWGYYFVCNYYCFIYCYCRTSFYYL